MSDWISVDERLPETDTDCLAVHRGGKVLQAWYGVSGIYGDPDEPLFYSIRDGYEDQFNASVTHWQPLPDPPKGESDE